MDASGLCFKRTPGGGAGESHSKDFAIPEPPTSLLGSVSAPALELADIFRIHGPAYLATYGAALSAGQRKALRDIAVYRTAALGGHVEQCDRCGHRTIAYCSCRNRHCPKCQSAARGGASEWLGRASQH
jgi:hypothetical protein